MSDTPLILAVGAAESECLMETVSSAGAIGIMQVIPRPWLASEHRLKQTPYNFYYGMHVLDGAIELAEGDLRFALAYYNCSVDNVKRNQCGTKGGLNYARDVLEFWMPIVEQTLEEDHVQ